MLRTASMRHFARSKINYLATPRALFASAAENRYYLISRCAVVLY